MSHNLSQKYAEAISLALWDLLIIPLRGKRPIVPDWRNKATCNLDTIEAWWTRWPDANIGCKPRPGIIAVDIDPRHGGDSTWWKLNTRHALPKTLVTRTGSGGQHIWFRLPYIAPLNRHAGPGIDIQSEKQCLVMPGSTHPETGRQYECETWHDPNNLPELPAHLHRHIYKRPPRRRKVTPIRRRGGNSLAAKLIAEVANAQPSVRNDTLNRAAFIATKANLHIEEELASAAACAGLTESEIVSTITSARNGALKGAA